jgi:membrane protein implicated in regulation of membrane protease activity
MAWWIWFLFGLALLALEMLTPGGFYVLFFGVGALLVGALVAAGMVGSVPLQWLLFSLLSIASLLLFRRRLLESLGAPPAKRDELDTLRDEIAVLSEDIAPGAIGKAELRGTAWTARNIDERPLRLGQRCRVARIEGLTLLVRAE